MFKTYAKLKGIDTSCFYIICDKKPWMNDEELEAEFDNDGSGSGNGGIFFYGDFSCGGDGTGCDGKIEGYEHYFSWSEIERFYFDDPDA
jgi:hypothetical protein